MRNLHVILAVALASTFPCWADPAPLPPGKPASVKKANLVASPLIIWGGFAAIAILGYELSKGTYSGTSTTGTGS